MQTKNSQRNLDKMIILSSIQARVACGPKWPSLLSCTSFYSLRTFTFTASLDFGGASFIVFTAGTAGLMS